MWTQEELLHWLRLGGVTLVSLLFSSVLAVAVFVERFLAHQSFIKNFRRLSERVSKLLSEKVGLDAIRTKISEGNYPQRVSAVFLAGIKAAHAGADYERVIARTDRERQRAGIYLKRFMWILGTIGAVTPFVGLFGTVYGIMSAMGDIAATGNTGFTVVADGISEALIATAVGIAVAIEAVVLFNALQARLGNINTEAKLLTEEFLEEIKQAPRAGAPYREPAAKDKDKREERDAPAAKES
jgi:biopolymer transport protein ExbB